MQNPSAIVIGLEPKQAQAVASEFKGRGVGFITKERAIRATIPESANHVVLMTKFIGHDIQERIDRDKRVMVNGGVTDLKKTLKRLLPSADQYKQGLISRLEKLNASVEKATKKAALTAAERDAEFAKLAHPISVQMPAPADDYVRFYADSSGRLSGLTTAIRGFKPGEKMLVVRPEGMSKQTLLARVCAMRSHEKRVNGVRTEQKTLDEGELITVNGTLNTPIVQAPQAPQVAPVAEAVAEAVVMPVQSAGATLWRETVMLSMQALPGAPIATVIERADEVLAAFTQRFGGVPQSTH